MQPMNLLEGKILKSSLHLAFCAAVAAAATATFIYCKFLLRV